MAATAHANGAGRVGANEVTLNNISAAVVRQPDTELLVLADDIPGAGCASADDVIGAVRLDKDPVQTVQTRGARSIQTDVISLHRVVITHVNLDNGVGAAENVACGGRGAANSIVGARFHSHRGVGCGCCGPGGINADKIALNNIVAAALLKPS